MPRTFLPTIAVALICVTAAACAARGRIRHTPLPALSAVREFVVPWENAFPNDVAIDSLGRVWFTDRLTHAIGMFDPATEQFTRYETPTRPSAPYGIATAPDGGIWFAESTAQRIARIDPATAQIIEHRIAGSTRGPNLIAIAGPIIWFTLREERAIGRYHIATGVSTIIRTDRTRPYGISIAPNGTVWFGVAGSVALHAVDARTNNVTLHDVAQHAPIPTSASPTASDSVRRAQARRLFAGEMLRIAADRSGNVWYGDVQRGHVVRYAPATPGVTAFASLQRGSRPYGIAVTSAGHVWYAETGTGEVVVLDPVTEERRRAKIEAKGAVVRNLIVDEKRGRVWLPMSDAGKLGLIELR